MAWGFVHQLRVILPIGPKLTRRPQPVRRSGLVLHNTTHTTLNSSSGVLDLVYFEGRPAGVLGRLARDGGCPHNRMGTATRRNRCEDGLWRAALFSRLAGWMGLG